MKDTCKQAIFRKDTRRVRRAEDFLRTGDQKERELEFFNNMYKALSTKFQVSRPHRTTKLPIKQIQSCTTPKIHREPFLNHSHQIFGQQISQSHQKFDKRTNSVQILHLWYIKVQNGLSKIKSYFPKARNRIV